VEIDHVLIAVSDLQRAGQALETRYGLASLAGGRHPGWGTANRIVPLGETYLELIAVVDSTAARDSVVGRWVAAAASEPGSPLGWAVRTDDIDSLARRLQLSVSGGSRVTPSRALLHWRSCGIEAAAAEPSLPFFIEWAPGTQHPGRAQVGHPAGRVVLSRLLVRGDAGRLAAWLGPHALPVEVLRGDPELAGIVLSRGDDEILLGAGPARLARDGFG
jgi:hypothetical protein